MWVRALEGLYKYDYLNDGWVLLKSDQGKAERLSHLFIEIFCASPPVLDELAVKYRIMMWLIECQDCLRFNFPFKQLSPLVYGNGFVWDLQSYHLITTIEITLSNREYRCKFLIKTVLGDSHTLDNFKSVLFACIQYEQDPALKIDQDILVGNHCAVSDETRKSALP